MSTSGQGRNLATIIGANIRRERVSRVWTQHELAGRVGGKTNSQRISDWERGAYRPSDASLQRLAEILNRDLAHFFTDHDQVAA